MKDFEDEVEFFSSFHAWSFFFLARDGGGRWHAMQTSDWGATKVQISKRESRKTNFVSKAAKHWFEPDWTYKAFWTAHDSCWVMTLLLLSIFLRFSLLPWAKYLLVHLSFQVRLIRDCQFRAFPQHTSQSSCLGRGARGDVGLFHLQVLPLQLFPISSAAKWQLWPSSCSFIHISDTCLFKLLFKHCSISFLSNFSRLCYPYC